MEIGEKIIKNDADVLLDAGTLGRYWVCYTYGNWSMKVVMDGRLPRVQSSSLRVSERMHEVFMERVRTLGCYAYLGGRGRLERLFWHYLAQRPVGSMIFMPHVSYIKRETMEETYDNVFRKRII